MGKLNHTGQFPLRRMRRMRANQFSRELMVQRSVRLRTPEAPYLVEVRQIAHNN